MIKEYIVRNYHHYYKRDDTYKLYKLYDESQYWSRDDLIDYQIALFNNLWSHCLANVPYYKGLSENTGNNIKVIQNLKDLQSINIITKDIIRANLKDLQAVNLESKRFMSNSTSGSSGSNIKFYSDKNQAIHNKALEMRRYNWMNSNIYNKELTIWGASWEIKKNTNIDRLKGWLRNSKMISGYRLSDDDIINIQKFIKTYKPKSIKSYPSILITLIEQFADCNFSYNPDFVHIGGEKLMDFQRQKIEDFFQAPVYDFYGARDASSIAQECDHFNGLHVFMENAIVEVVDENGQQVEDGEGDIIITNLHNYAMPLIRYKIGDRARISKNKVCTCGRNLILLDEIIGRIFEIIKFPNGNRVGGTFWTFVMKSAPGVRDFQVVQVNEDRINIYYIPDKDHSKYNVDLIKQNILSYAGEQTILDFQMVDQIPETKAGKKQFVISKVN